MTSEGKTKIKRKVVKDIPSAMAGIKSLLRKDGSHEWSKIYKEFKENGGKAGWMDFNSIEEKMSDIEKSIKKSQGRKSITKGVLKLIEDYNEVVENAVRLSTYKNLVDSGISKKKSAHYAKDLTVNFNRKGEYSHWVNTLWTFSNAGMQGTNRIYRALKGKNGRKVAMGLTSLGFLTSALNRYMDEEEWDQFIDYNKDNYFMLMLPNKKALALKLPYGWNWFYSIGGAMEQTMFGDDNFGDLIGRTTKNAVDAFAPISGGSFSQFAVPTFLDFPVQISENKNFFGGEIMKDKDRYGKTLKDHERGFKSVSPTLKELTKQYYDLTGFDVSPSSIEHFIDSYSGGTGRFVANTVNTLIETGKGTAPDVNKVPVLRQFIKGKSSYRSMQKAKEMLKKADSKKLDGDLMIKYLKEGVSNDPKNSEIAEKYWEEFLKKQIEVMRRERINETNN
tara:strand:- start:1469 stop:2812 length:1344 start_codon:yes stop_codon:yes gene_type:complete